MASVIFNTPYLSHPTSISPTIVKKSSIYASVSTSQVSCSRTLTIHLGLTPFPNWNGLRKNGFSISLQSLKLEKRKKCKGKSGVFASLFGVGAPEALVIGVVALLVFGPKGLADVAKNLGKTLRAFQPTIRELQEVSREFKSTLEKEIGLDELNNPVQGNYTSTTVKPPSTTQVPPELTVAPPPPETTTTTTATGGSPEDSPETTASVTMKDSQPTVDSSNGTKFYSSEDLLKITEQLKAVASQQPKEQPPSPISSDTPKNET